jgi:hypothetical protein
VAPSWAMYVAPTHLIPSFALEMTHPKLLDGLNCEFKGEDNGRRSWVCSLAHNTSRVEGRDGASRWGLQRLTSKSIIHTDLHKKLVSA